jgi:type 1 fimbriae regulatory protein FimB
MYLCARLLPSKRVLECNGTFRRCIFCLQATNPTSTLIRQSLGLKTCGKESTKMHEMEHFRVEHMEETKIATMSMKRFHLFDGEVEELCQTARDDKDYRLWCAVVFGFNHGFRVSELAGGSKNAGILPLQLSDIDIKERRVHVRRLKGGVDMMHHLIDLRGNVTMSDVPALREYLKVRINYGGDCLLTGQKGPMQRQTLNLLFKSLCKRVSDARQKRGLPAIPKEAMHFHALRHSIGTKLANSSAGIFHAKNHLGHAAISSTQIYAHPDARATALRVGQVLAGVA